MTSITRRTALLAGLALAIASAGCGGGGDSDGEGGSGAITAAAERMVWALQSPPVSLDVAKAADIVSMRVQTAIYDRLLSIDNDGEVEPWIASSFQSPDPLTWIFTIREGVNFWDGSALTVDDVVYSIERHTGADNSSFVAANFALIESVEATDDSTVTVTLVSPDPSLPAKLAMSAMIVQQAYSESAGDDLGGPDKPGMGTGPYSVSSYSSADGAVLTRNDEYWAGQPVFASLEFTVISDPDAARLAMTSGEIDGYFDVPLIATRQWDELDNASISYVTGAYNDMMSMDVTRAPFDDIDVRRAMAHLIDREGLLQPLFNGHATTARTIVPATQITSSFGEEGAAEFYTGIPEVPVYSIEMAREALAASASPDGFTVDLPVDTSQPWMSPLAQSLAQNAAEIGVTINVQPVASADWVAGLANPESSPLQLVALGAGSPWPGELPPVLLGSAAGYPVAFYATDEVDELSAAVTAAATLDELRAPLAGLLTAAANDLPIIPLFDEQTATAIRDGFIWKGGYSYWALGQAWALHVGSAE